MAISENLFHSILAMDAYDRGYQQRLVVDGTQIGLATVGQSKGELDAQAIGFFAQSYIWNGKTIISYRGTDDLSNDVLYGWTTSAGYVGPGSQAWMALQFNQDVTGHSLSAGPASNVILTGHSLGGGLAGIMSAITGTDATIFDHNPITIAP